MPALSINLAVVAFAVVGAIWGAVADRIGARWPAHEDGSVRRVDWRSVVVVAFGAVAFGAIPARFGAATEQAIFLGFFAAFVLLMATDLDQRLMPDVLTLPAIALAAAVGLAGLDPLLSGKAWWLPVVAAVAVPGILFLASLPFGEGAFGMGDVKFLIGFGLLVGLARSVVAVFAAALLAGVVIFVLLLARRITLRSYVPFGPFLIAGALWAVLLPAAS